MKDKITLVFTSLVVGTATFIAGVTVTDSEGNETQAVVSTEDAQRLLRDHAEAQRKFHQEVGNKAKQQWWLNHRRGYDKAISEREYYKLAYPYDPVNVPPNPDPDPDPDPTPDPDPDPDPGPDPDPAPTDPPTWPIDLPDGTAYLPGTMEVGGVSNIAATKQEDKFLIHAMALIDEGWRVILHVQDTETWEVVEGTSIDFRGDKVSIYSPMIWAELEIGKTYRAEVWTVQTLEGDIRQAGDRKTLYITP